MPKNYGVEVSDSYKNGKVLLKQPRIIIATMGMFQLDKTVHLRSAFKSKGFQIKQTEWEIYLTGIQKLPTSSKIPQELH